MLSALPGDAVIVDAQTVITALLGALLAASWAWVQVALVARIKRLEAQVVQAERLVHGEDGTAGLVGRIAHVEAQEDRREAVRVALEAAAERERQTRNAFDALLEALRRRSVTEDDTP